MNATTDNTALVRALREERLMRRLRVVWARDSKFSVKANGHGHPFWGNQWTEVSGQASRFRPKEKIHFPKPLHGPSGAKLVAYEWMFKPEEYIDKQGEERVRRVSDWENAEDSSETGRGLVHQFHVEMPDSDVRMVSSESVPKLLGYFGENHSPAQAKSVISAVKTLAKLKMKLAVVESKLAHNEAVMLEVEKLPFPSDKVVIEKAFPNPDSNALRAYLSDDKTVYQIQHEQGQPTESTLRSLQYTWRARRAKERGYVNVHESVRDIKNRIARQEKKLGQSLEPQSTTATDHATLLSCVRAERLARRVEAVQAAEDTTQVAKALIRDSGGLVLILKDAHYGTWDLPGGHIQQGESLLEGLSREVREETGLEPHAYFLSKRQGPGGIYETKVSGHKPPVTLSPEHTEYRWVELAKAEVLAPYRLGSRELDRHRAAQAAAEEPVRRAVHKAVTYAEGAVLHRQAATEAGKAAVAAGVLGLLAIGAFKAYQAARTALEAPEPAPRQFAPVEEEKRAGEPIGTPGEGLEAEGAKEAEEFAGERREKLTRLAEKTVGDLEEERVAAEAAGVGQSEVAARLEELAQRLEGETWSSAVNTESQAAYGNAQIRMLARGGFKTKAWVSMHDDKVRVSHVLCDLQDDIPLGQKFKNGLMYPGDPDGPPEEVCNCRCLLVGVKRAD